MVAIRYAGQRFELGSQQSVLDALEAGGVPVPSSCRSGVCQTCLLRAVEGVPPAAAQQGLKDSLKHQGYFLACVCHPLEDLEVALPGELGLSVPATVRALERLNSEIVRVVLEPDQPIEYRPGQFILAQHAA